MRILWTALAGLAIAASDLRGQRDLLSASPAVGRLHRLGDHEELAAHLRDWQQNTGALVSAKQSSLASAKTTWNAEHEGEKVVEAVASTLGLRSAATLASCG